MEFKVKKLPRSSPPVLVSPEYAPALAYEEAVGEIQEALSERMVEHIEDMLFSTADVPRGVFTSSSVPGHTTSGSPPLTLGDINRSVRGLNERFTPDPFTLQILEAFPALQVPFLYATSTTEPPPKDKTGKRVPRL